MEEQPATLAKTCSRPSRWPPVTIVLTTACLAQGRTMCLGAKQIPVRMAMPSMLSGELATDVRSTAVHVLPIFRDPQNVLPATVDTLSELLMASATSVPKAVSPAMTRAR